MVGQLVNHPLNAHVQLQAAPHELIDGLHALLWNVFAPLVDSLTADP